MSAAKGSSRRAQTLRGLPPHSAEAVQLAKNVNGRLRMAGTKICLPTKQAKSWRSFLGWWFSACSVQKRDPDPSPVIAAR